MPDMLTDIMNVTAHRECTSGAETAGSGILSVLYVDDEPALLEICKLYLERQPDISVTTTRSVTHAFALLGTMSFDVIISDYQMPGTDGIAFLKLLRKTRPFIPFILFTGRGRDEVMAEAMQNGATCYIQKEGHPRALFADLSLKIRQSLQQIPASPAEVILR